MMKVINAGKSYWNSIRVGWFLAIRQLRRTSWGTTSLIVFVMVLTFLNLVVVSGLLVGLIAGSFKQFEESYSGQVIATAATGKNFIEHSKTLEEFFRGHPRVEAFTARYGTQGRVLGTLDRLPEKNRRPNQMSARISGIDPIREESVTQFSRFILRGEMLEPGDDGKLLMGANLIRKYSSFADANIPGLDLLEDVDVGSRVRVTIATGEGDITKEFIVKGLVKSKVDEISTRIFVTDSELRRLLPVTLEEYQEIAVVTDRTYAPYLVAEAKQVLTEDDARIQTSSDAIPSFLRQIELTMSVLGNALSSIALVVASITIFIVIYINAVTKRKFIGIMKGIGISPLAIEFSYTVQALFYGVAGSVIGLIATFGFLQPYFEANPINFPFSDGILVATIDGTMLRMIILIVITLMAGYLPAQRIVRKNTLDAILGR